MVAAIPQVHHCLSRNLLQNPAPVQSGSRRGAFCKISLQARLRFPGFQSPSIVSQKVIPVFSGASQSSKQLMQGSSPLKLHDFHMIQALHKELQSLGYHLQSECDHQIGCQSLPFLLRSAPASTSSGVEINSSELRLEMFSATTTAWPAATALFQDLLPGSHSLCPCRPGS